MFIKNICLIFSLLNFSPIFATSNDNIPTQEFKIINGNKNSNFNNKKTNIYEEFLDKYADKIDRLFYTELERKPDEFYQKISKDVNYFFNSNEELINEYKDIQKIFNIYKNNSCISKGYNNFNISELNEAKEYASKLANKIQSISNEILEIKSQIILNPNIEDNFINYYIKSNLLILTEKAYYAAYNAAPPYLFSQNAKGRAALYANDSRANQARELRKQADEAYKKANKAYNLYVAASKSNMKGFFNKENFLELRQRYYDAEEIAKTLDEKADNAFNTIK